MLEVFRNRKMATLALMGFASGLPLYLTSRTLQAWMAVEGVNITAIGLFSLVSLPYSFKFLWSPLIDRFSFASLGRRRGWLLITQAALTISIATMAFARPAQALELLALNAVVIAFLSATQDIAIDAYRTDVLHHHEMGAGAGVAVLGYRIALIVAGSAALILADYASWPVVYLLLAGVMLTALATTIQAPEPKLRDAPPLSLAEAVQLPFMEFFHRGRAFRSGVVLAFVVLYRLGDSLISNMSTPFLLQTGFTQTDVGTIQGGLGLVSTIVGVLAGGEIISRVGIYKSLWVFGALQAISNLAYLILATLGRNYPFMISTVMFRVFCKKDLR